MEEISGNTSSEMLTLLVDGELDSSQEMSLYASLAESDELRTQMREHLAIRESIRKDTEAYNPPKSSKKAILAAIGLNPGAVANAPITQIAVQSSFWGGFWSKVWLPVVSGVVATIITSLLFLTNNNSEYPVKQSANSSMKVPIVSSTAVLQPEKSAGNLKSTVISSGKKLNRGTISQNRKIFASVSEDNSAEQNQILPQNETIKPIELASADGGNSKTYNLSENSALKNNLPLTINSPKKFVYLNPNKLNNLDISLILKGISATSFPNVDEPAGSGKPMISSFSIGAYVTLIEGLDAGMEIGQENFGQKFYDKREGILYLVPQNPIIGWAGIGVRGKIVKPVDFLAGAKPFAQAFIGGTKIGPLAKLSGGLEYSWDNGIGILVGIEGGSLFYNNQGTWYSTEKLGFTYGLIYNF